ncbi:hypothetical protein WMF38_06455 [Sorangium sp. So ce118]
MHETAAVGRLLIDMLDWANAWHALGSLPFPSEDYNAALQAITTRFAGRNAAPGRPNGSSLGQLRTNDIALASPWELREFTLAAAIRISGRSSAGLCRRRRGPPTGRGLPPPRADRSSSAGASAASTEPP